MEEVAVVSIAVDTLVVVEVVEVGMEADRKAFVAVVVEYSCIVVGTALVEALVEDMVVVRMAVALVA